MQTKPTSVGCCPRRRASFAGKWATPEAQQLAQEQGVEWLTNSTPSPGLIALRQLPDPHYRA
ncbi:MAG: hypothetical protein ABDI19_06885 [Armatimonadota bacterium]